MPNAGIALSTYEPGALSKVPEHLDRNPEGTFDLTERLGARVTEWVEDRYGDEDRIKLSDIQHRLPMDILRLLSLDELCKLRFASPLMMDTSVEDAFKSEPRLMIYHKITNGMWRWGCGRAGWNEIVDVYEGIRSFDLGHPDFELRLDHSTYCNPCGYSEHSRTYLDGVFGYLVHYKGEHVMTLGFSFMDERRLLIQQVQLKNRRGNRWLFKLPRNYLEYVIGRFRDAFPNHRVFLVDGQEVMGRSLKSYRSELANAEKRLAEVRKSLPKCAAEDEPYLRSDIEYLLERIGKMRECIAHAEPEVGRIGAFYAAMGRYLRGGDLKINQLTHYEVIQAMA